MDLLEKSPRRARMRTLEKFLTNTRHFWENLNNKLLEEFKEKTLGGIFRQKSWSCPIPDGNSFKNFPRSS